MMQRRRIHGGRLLKRKVNRSIGGDLVIFLFLLAGAVFMGLPILYAVCNS